MPRGGAPSCERSLVSGETLSLIVPAPPGNSLASLLDRVLALEEKLAGYGFARLEVVVLETHVADAPPQEPIQVGSVQLLPARSGESSSTVYRRALASARGSFVCLATVGLARNPAALFALVKAAEETSDRVGIMEAPESADGPWQPTPQATRPQQSVIPQSHWFACLGPTSVLAQVLRDLTGELDASSLRAALQKIGIAVASVPAPEPAPEDMRPWTGASRGLWFDRSPFSLIRPRANGVFAGLRRWARRFFWVCSLTMAGFLVLARSIPETLLEFVTWLWACAAGSRAGLAILAQIAATMPASVPPQRFPRAWGGVSPQPLIRAACLAGSVGVLTAALWLFSTSWPVFAPARWLLFATSLLATVLGVELFGLAVLLRDDTALWFPPDLLGQPSDRLSGASHTDS